MSADVRLPLVYAISDEGHFEFADTIKNEGLAFFMRTVDARIADCLENRPSLDDYPNASFKDDAKFSFMSSHYDVLPPKLTKEMSRLNQGAPFNLYCFDNMGNKVVTGCAPVTMVALLSHYKYPESHKGYTFYWDEMRENRNHESIARLIRLLWSSDNLATFTVNINGTINVGADPKRYVPTLENLGFDVPDGMQDFDPAEVYSILARGTERPWIGSPVLVRGLLDKNNNYGHAWVIDGAMKQKPIGQNINGPIYPGGVPKYLFHCVWGWGGVSNGYFNFTDDSIGGLPEVFHPDDDKVVAANPYNFTFNLQYIGRIYKK
ncbi:MAG: C10 family peptidase [Prevotella sp.]|nr:C10 family peptidase [Prevotella sp.]